MHYIGRFAPSPSGPLHFGSLLAALGSYLQARQANGDWLLRIEDLDQPRTAPGAADNIIATLDAFGFEWCGPIEYQSRRLPLYEAAFEQLRASGCLYECSCSRSQIAALALGDAQNNDSQNDHGQESEDLRYPGTCRDRHDRPIGATAWRMRLTPEAVQFVDGIQGAQSQDVAATVGDFVVRRRDGLFAYHLAVVVDDADQRVTEVVRGADLLTSTPRQILLQRALGLPTPRYCHLPLAIDSAGRKLSKSAQSRAIDPRNASALLHLALSTLRQNPPAELACAPVREIWTWASAHWTLAPLAGQRRCPAPAP